MPSSKKPRASKRDAGKNLIRGLVGATRAKSFRKEAIDEAGVFQASRKATFLEARAQLESAEFERYLRWAEQQLAGQIPSAIAEQPARLSALSRLENAPHLPLEKELAWVTARLSLSIDSLAEFRQLAEGAEVAYWSQDLRGLMRRSLAMRRRFGQSVWLVEANIACRQQFAGLEHQKRYAARTRRRAGKGALGFLAYYFSVRNEPGTTTSRFNNDLTTLLREDGLKPGARTYLAYKLLGDSEDGPDELSTILRVEQSTTDIDLYETLVYVLQKLAQRSLPASPAIAAAARVAIDKLSGTSDGRLAQLRPFFTAMDAIPSSANNALDALLSGDLKKTLRLALRALSKEPARFSSALLAAYALSARQNRRPPASGLWIGLVDRMASLFAKDSSFGHSQNDLSKFVANNRFLVASGAISSVLWSETEAFSHSLVAPYRRRALFRSDFEPLDAIFDPSLSAMTYDANSSQGKLVRSIVDETAMPKGIHPTIRTFLQAAALLMKEQTAETLLLLKDFVPREGSIDLAIAQLRLRALISEGMTGDAVRLCAILSVTWPRVQSVLPLDQLLGGLSWFELEPLANDISLPIVLDLYWRAKKDSDSATLRRFAFEEFMARAGVTLPSDIAMPDRHKELVYFLRNVCVPTVMDMYVGFESTRAISDERVRICSALRTLDEHHRADYDLEIFEITSRNEVQDGLSLVNRSRVHVDTDAIAEWAVAELGEYFRRYMDLANVSKSSAEDKDIISKPSSSQQPSDIFAVPESEQNSILLTLMYLLAERFLFDPNHGLDSYLSRRVRHGSIVNYLRGPVEKAGLITQRDASTKRYQPNETWPSRVALPQATRQLVQRQFDQFSEAFDAIALNLKDRFLHVRSNEHRHGLISMPISPASIRVLARHLTDDPAFDGFLRGSFAVFWAQLDQSLTAVRAHLSGPTKAEIAQTFDVLRAGLAPLLATDATLFAELSMAIGNASADVHRQLDIITQWFNRGTLEHYLNEFTAEQAMRIAVASALNANTGFQPTIANKFTLAEKVTAESLVNLTECVWVIIENARTHSGIRSPEIEISGETAGADTVRFRIVTQCAQGTKTSQVEGELDLLRAKIAAGEIDEAQRREGKSGLMKVASVARSISFGFESSSNAFVVEVELEHRLDNILRTVSTAAGAESASADS